MSKSRNAGAGRAVSGRAGVGRASAGKDAHASKSANAANAQRHARIGLQDFEACLYPLIQREAGKDAPANCWELRLAPENARTLTLPLAARFAFDALAHLSAGEPSLDRGFIDEALVIAAPDRSLPPGKIAVQASLVSPQEAQAKRARASVIGHAAMSKKDLALKPAAKLISVPIRPENHESGRKGDTMTFKSIFASLKDLAKPPASKSTMANRQIDPVTLIQSVLDEVDANAMAWPSGRDLPHRVIVSLSQADYSYYGPRKRASEQHVEQALLSYARECGALLERDPHVSIKLDPLLYGGQLRIETSFSDGGASAGPQEPNAKDASSNPVLHARLARESSAPSTSNPQAPESAGARASGKPAAFESQKTPEYKPRGNAAMRTPICTAAGTKQAVAKLSSPSFQAAVLPGDSIGRVRYDDARPAPDIALEGADFEFVSHDQGTFSFENDTWSFTSTGRNGTSVQRKGAWLKLPEGESFPLEDGDCLSFAKSAPLTFSIAS